MRYILFAFFIALFIITFTSSALAFRCGNEIPSLWDKSGAIQAKCGNPYQRSSGNENINGTIKYVEKWFYNCGENDFIYEISIHNGIVVKIDSAQRGIGKGQCE